MAMERIHWEDLPTAARAAVEQHAGHVLKAETVSGGVNSGIAARVHTAEAVMFVKGVPLDHPQARSHEREAAVNPYLPDACPRILWRTQAAGWDLIGYALLQGRHADYAPGSLDLPLVAQAVAELQEADCPEDGRAVKRAEDRWAAYAVGADTNLFAGETLLHTDLAPHNVLITGRAHLIDWAWPTRGAAWIDPAVWVMRLMKAGHSPAQADRWASSIPSWGKAPAEAVDMFNQANVRAWEEIAGHDPQPWKAAMARHARTWAAYWRSR